MVKAWGRIVTEWGRTDLMEITGVEKSWSRKVLLTYCNCQCQDAYVVWTKV